MAPPPDAQKWTHPNRVPLEKSSPQLKQVARLASEIIIKWSF